jgi:H-type small acid-soluble spore protein
MYIFDSLPNNIIIKEERHDDMNVGRAMEIFESTGVIDVNYNGCSVWIKNINPQEATAEIEILDTPNNNEIVNVNDLHEGTID